MRKGFTLIELMIVVVIIGTLAAIAVPKFANLIRRSNEGSSKANLGQIRSALSIYYGDMEGQYPADLAALTSAARKYLDHISVAKAPNYHQESSVPYEATASDDGGGWLYDDLFSDANFGSLWVNCTHTDTAGRIWTQF